MKKQSRYPIRTSSLGNVLTHSIFIRRKGEKDFETNSLETWESLQEKQTQYFSTEGFKDGSLGKSQTGIKSLAEGNAQSLKNALIELVEVNIHRSEAQVEVSQQSVEKAEADFQGQKEYHERVDKEYKKDTSKFSFLLGSVYLLIAFVLILSDIPLALKLTQQGFDLDMDINHPVQALFERPWEVFQGNWEVFLLAIGIALCSVFVKIYYDEFVSRPIDKIVEEMNRLRGLESKGDSDRALKVKSRRYWIKTALLAFSMLNIATLGVFRFQTELQIKKEERVLQELPNETDFSFLDEGGETSEELTLPEPSWEHQLTSLFAFIGITLLFPLIGGICASLGLNAIFNARALRLARRTLCKAESELELAQDSLKESKGEIARWNSKQETLADPNYVSNLAKLLFGLYNKRYEEGFHSSTQDPDESSGSSSLLDDFSRKGFTQPLWDGRGYSSQAS